MNQAAFDALGMRHYIWRYPRGSYIQERWFDLGNPGLMSCRMPNLAVMFAFSRFRSGSLILVVTALLTSCAVPSAPAAFETQIEERSYRIGMVHALSGEGVTHAVPVGIGVHRAVSDASGGPWRTATWNWWLKTGNVPAGVV